MNRDGKLNWAALTPVLLLTAAPGSLGAAPQVAPELRLAENPLFHSGGHPDQRVSVIGSLSGAMFLGADRVVFVDGMSQQLVFVNTSSGTVGSAGRKGDGPGEFKRVRLLTRSADGSVVVWDPGGHRSLLRVVKGDGVVDELRGYDKSDLRSGRMTEPVATYGDGTVIYKGRELPTTDMFSPEPREPGRYRITFDYWLVVPGEPKRLLFEGLDSERFRAGAVTSGSARTSWTGDVIFGHSLLQTQVGEYAAVSQTDLGSVIVFDRSGRVAAEVPLEEGRAVTQVEIDAARERRLAANAEETRMIREQMLDDFPVDVASQWAKRSDHIRTVPANDIAPPIDRMQGDLDGRLWLRLLRPGETGQRWQAWELAGPSLEFTLVLPEGEVFLDAAGDRVLVGAKDEFDVDYVLVKEIVR